MLEAYIEQAFIDKLQELKYAYRPDIRDRDALERNFRQKFDALNKVRLTDNEFQRLLDELTTADVFEASKRLRQINTFLRDDSTPLHYQLVNLKDWCKNDFEVINQLRINTRSSHRRYDVILLINGLPLVQVELKTLAVSPRKALEQVVRYKSDPDNGYTRTLLCFMQLFVVSNRTDTFYFTNNNEKHFRFNAEEQFLPVYRWADEKNNKITHLDEFAHAFLSKCTLAEMISRYMVLVEVEKKILMMRPYQIYAVKAIMESVRHGSGNGFIWHTTGSGKTLTSFKASTLMKDNPGIDKCMFVVDRKDLDRQTREEFNRFQPGCVEENTNTDMLVRRLLSGNNADKVIVTTIQKLGLALDPKNGYTEKLHKLKDKRFVFIFDECHRSQFGEYHRAIKEFFPRAQLFGFTGTPIFEENATYKRIDGTTASFVTTKDVFETLLHAYTITHAIDDRNVLRFHIDYYKPETPVSFDSPEHKQAVVKTILQKHDAATNRRRFNALFATASINDAIEYYHLFQKMQAEKQGEDPDFEPLHIACVFTPPAEGNKDIRQLQEDLEQEKEDNKIEPGKKKAALQQIIDDYNRLFGTNFTLATFDLYYQDVQQRIKMQRYPNREVPRSQKLDIVIVVDMLLTGFDSQYLNTLYVDKNLKYHGLIQAFSRTNRVLNDTKPYGNILDFRQQQHEVDRAIALFGGETPEKSKQVWLVEPAPVVIEKYEEAVEKLEEWLQMQDLVAEPQAVYNLRGDESRIEFINRFKEVQRLRTQLDQYTDLTEEQKQKIESLLPEDKLTEFRTAYLETARQIREIQQTEGDNAPPEIQQLDLELVLFASALIDYDYIMKLISEYTGYKTKKYKITRDQLLSMLSSNANLMDEREDLAEYINTLQTGVPLTEEQIRQGYEEFKENKRLQQLQSIAQRHGIPFDLLKDFVQNTVDRLILDSQRLSDLFAGQELGWKARSQKETALMKDLIPLLKKMAEGRAISGLKAYELG